MKSRLAKAMRYSSFCLAVLTVGVGSAQDIMWVGGDSGNVNVKANWDPQWIPNSQTGDTPLIAVFTNSVTISNDGGSWSLSGFKVRNNSAVTVKGSVSNNRIQASNVCTEFIVDVETGSSLTHVKGSASDMAFYAQKKSFRKIGGGTFKPGSRFGWSGDNPMATLTVEEGTLDASGSAIRCNGEIKVC